MAKNAFNERRELFSKRLSKELKKKVIMTKVWSVALYGSKTLTLSKYERNRLEAFEMWTCPKILPTDNSNIVRIESSISCTEVLRDFVSLMKRNLDIDKNFIK